MKFEVTPKTYRGGGMDVVKLNLMNKLVFLQKARLEIGDYHTFFVS